MDTPDAGYFPWAPYEIGEWNYYGEFWRSSTAYVYAMETASHFYAPYAACRYTGIYSLVDGWEAGYPASGGCATHYGEYNAWCTSATCDPNVGNPPNYAVFGTQAMAANAWYFVNDLFGVNVYISDRDAPTVSASGIPPGWVQDATFQANGYDSGVGVNNVGVTGGQAWNSGCSVDPTNHCPANATVTADTTSLPEGINTINATATDLIGGPGHTFNGTIGQVKIDRSPPLIAAAGRLHDRADKPVNGDATLDIDAYDPAPSGGLASGVAGIELRIDGALKASQYQHCDTTTDLTGCELSLPTYSFHAPDYTDGPHTIGVTVTDNAGNVSTSQWTVTVANSASLMMPCTDQGAAVNFPVYSLGAVFDTLVRHQIIRTCDVPDPADVTAGHTRENSVTVSYGDCVADQPDANHEAHGCIPPLQIQTFPACERNSALYRVDTEGTPMPRTDTTVRGVPAAYFDDSDTGGASRLEIYTGSVTVVLFGPDVLELLAAAQSMLPTLPNPFTDLDPLIHTPTTAPLLAPVSGALDGTLTC